MIKHLLLTFTLITSVTVAFSQRGWEKRTTGISKDLTDVYFTNPQNGWAVGHSGMILHTTDGGANWFVQDSHSQDFFEGIWFSADLKGWIVGSSGTILKTTDGVVWSRIETQIFHTLYDVMFSDADNGWITGDVGLILHTTDSGSEWHFQLAGTGDPITSVSFSDANSGYLAGTFESGWLRHSVNGGEIWTDFSIPDASQTNVVFTISPYRAWVGGNGIIYFTDDIGDTWAEQYLPGNPGPVIDLFFVDDNHGWALAEQALFHTSDAGLSWEIQLELDGTNYFAALHFSDPDHGCAVGNKGSIYTTTDGGSTAIPENAAAPAVQAVPNPSGGIITITLSDGNHHGKPCRIEVFNIHGKKVKETSSVIQAGMTLDLSSLPKGIYSLRIAAESIQTSVKILLF